MPVEFLADEQAGAYRRLVEEPTRLETERFFYLDDMDRRLIGKRRGDHNRLRFALQTCTVRYLGLFLEAPLDVPQPVVVYVARSVNKASTRPREAVALWWAGCRRRAPIPGQR